MRHPTAWLLGAMLAGCGTGTGSSSGSSTTQVDGGDGLTGTAALEAAPWLQIDLVDGSVLALDTAPALTPGNLDRILVVRRVGSGRPQLGQGASEFARQAGEVATSDSVGTFRIAVCELTRAQWRHLAGTQPWASDPLSSQWTDREDLPATGMGFATVRQILAAWRPGQGRLRLPSAGEWEAAARAGEAGAFPWGESRATSEAARWALTADSRPTAAQPVAGLLANRFGLHDVCGNVWEYDAGGAIRGGSWADALALARPANTAAADGDSGHATIGLRLVYVP